MQMITGFRQQFVEASRLRFSYLEWGQPAAPPFVLLHGLTGHAHTWDHMAPRLAERYHVLALDQRGHGDTAHAETYATRDFVDDLDALAQHWQLGRFALMGLSMGAHNALSYAATHPDRITHLIAIDIPARMDRRKAPNWNVISKLAETGHHRYLTFDEAFADARAGTATAPDDNLRYRTKLNLIEHADGTMTLKYDPKAPARWEPEDLTQKLPLIQAPTLLVRGGLTTVLPIETAQHMVRAIPDCEMAQVDDSGHSVPTDRPEPLTDIVLEWMARRGG